MAERLDIDIKQIRRLKVILLISSLGSLVLLLLAAFEENIQGQWRGHQADYREAAIAKAQTDAARAVAEGIEIGFKQVFLPALDRVDRCTTCHVGIDDPAMVDQEPPIRTHPGNIFEHHPVDKFGCTVCHDGQGLAVQAQAAHGEVAHWDAPLLRGQQVYTSCSRCHYENDLYGWGEDLYARGGSLSALDQTELASSISGLDPSHSLSIARGKQLVQQSGCLGCHKYRGRGGTLGPDITYVGDKTKHDYDYQHLHGQHTPAAWLFGHFKRPGEVSPGSLMPDMNLTDEQAADLTSYMLGQHRKTLPAAHTPVPPRLSGQPVTGAQLYAMYCSACHGPQGHGATVRDPDLVQAIDAPRELMTPSLNHPDTLATASDDFLRHIIANGRHGTSMIAWSADEGGLSDPEIDRLIGFIRSWEPPAVSLDGLNVARGDARVGRALYRTRCMGCHGSQGQGGVGVALNSASFLAVASDEFLARSILHGRANTAMPSWKDLGITDLNDLVAFIRTWQPAPPDKQEVLDKLAEGKPNRRALRIGKSLYRSKCGACHGTSGEGGVGPSLNTDNFLAVVDDEYLFEAIVSGRPGTAMPAWSELAADDLVDVINYLRSWNDRERRELEPVVVRGDWERGSVLYQGVCAGCHGRKAEGVTGPQLGNPVFLATVSDAMLREWIRHGRAGSAMWAFLRGEQGPVELTDDQIDDVIAYLRYLELQPRVPESRLGVGIVSLGAELYASACASCHGLDGAGTTGSALSNPEFLRAASDGFLAATMVLGRDGTEMLAMGKGAQGNVELSSDDVSNVVAFLRSWEHRPPVAGIPARYVTGADTGQGAELFVNSCAGCHGGNGDDGWAPALNNRDFLAAATDGYLQATIARGRSNTAMRPFGKGTGGVAPLSTEEINNVVAYIRTWAAPENRPVVAPTAEGEQTDANGTPVAHLDGG
ncbi:MAG: c-type cytochrome [bacterium]|nr:c-type cytochrome [bacterium]